MVELLQPGSSQLSILREQKQKPAIFQPQIGSCRLFPLEIPHELPLEVLHRALLPLKESSYRWNYIEENHLSLTSQIILSSFVPHTADEYMHSGSEAVSQHYVLMHQKMLLHLNWLQISVVDYQTKMLTPPQSKERPNLKPCASCSEVKDTLNSHSDDGSCVDRNLDEFFQEHKAALEMLPTVMSPPWLTHIPLERPSQWIQGALSKPRCLALEPVTGYLKLPPKWYFLITQLLSDSNLAIMNFLKSLETAVRNFYQILNQREMSQTSPASSRFLKTLTFLFLKPFFSLMTYDY